jgi:hypothetical protein
MADRTKPYEEARKDADAFFLGDNLRAEVSLFRYALRAMDGAWIERYVDQSISSTVNLPADTRFSAIEGLYRKAWESGCKGITVFREGSRASVLERDESEGPHPTGTGSPAGVCTFCEAPTTEDPRAGG